MTPSDTYFFFREIKDKSLLFGISQNKKLLKNL